MGARFIGCDRDQVFLMPPSLRDWVPEGHLVWTVLDAVAELDLSAVYADYRDDGRGRPAYEPSMMVARLLYAYARGNRSSRGIERACVEDIAYRVVTGNLAPDHSTIAEFRCRHERPLGGVFSGVLGSCRLRPRRRTASHAPGYLSQHTARRPEAAVQRNIRIELTHPSDTTLRRCRRTRQEFRGDDICRTSMVLSRGLTRRNRCAS
jgi:transposase